VTHTFTAAVGAAFSRIDLSAVAVLQSYGKVEDRLRDDLLLELRRGGLPVTKGGPRRFDLYVPGEWAFELKMMYFGDHAFGLRGTRLDVAKLRGAADGMTQVLASVVSWHAGEIYPNARRCLHGSDRASCAHHWMDLLTEIAGEPPTMHAREDLTLFLAEI
jgi:hypothetical protein